MGNHAQAIKDFNQSLEIDPELSDGYFRRGFSKLYSKLFQDAILDFQQAYNLEKFQTAENKNFGILDGLGCCFHALGQLDKALQYYNKAIEGEKERNEKEMKESLNEEKPTVVKINTEFLMHRSQCYFDQQLYEKSIEDLHIGLEVREDDP